jgi:transposase
LVVAPTLIPVRSGDRVKMDRRDAIKLARLLRSGELTAAWVPDRAHEALRNLVRTRVSAKKDERRAKNRLSKFLLRMGMKQAKKTKSFGATHCQWLDTLGKKIEQESDRVSFEEYHAEWLHQHERVLRIENHIGAAIEKLPAEQQAVFGALCTLRGVAKTIAVTALAEVGSFSRFKSPRQLMSYAGVVPAEYSSGNSTKRGSITKTGNTFLRHVIAESAWSYRHSAVAGPATRQRRKDASVQVLAIAAVARELLGFMWAVAIEAEKAVQQVSGKKAKAA